jgi:hypothetical protein
MKLYLLIMWIPGIYGWNFMKNIELPSVQSIPKYCVNCKYSIVDPRFPNKIELSRCTAFPYEDDMLEPPINPVTGEITGEIPYHEKFYRCSSSRALERKCGKNGKRFVPK